MNEKRVMMETVSPDIRKENFLPFLKGYTLEEAKVEASRCLHCKVPKCQEACPIHNDIPTFIQAIKEERLDDAYAIIKKKSVLPEICGTVCPHEDQCEGHCVMGIRFESVNIGALERFVAKYAREKGLDDKVITSKEEKVACIGSGPASLACALVLADEGYKVDIYEKDDFIGGVLTWGIPSYRLEREAVDHIIDQLKKKGANFILNAKIEDLSVLKDYQAIFIGTGAPHSNAMRIPGEDIKGVYHADKFLTAINMAPLKDGKREFVGCGEKVVVVGGGNVAMDAARDAIRLPQVKEVTIVYRRSEKEMPACSEELEHAKEEGVVFKTLCNPVAFKGDDKLEEVECAIMELGEPDSSGRRRPVETDQRITIKADTAVLALGFSNDKAIAEINKIEADKWGCFKVDENGKTNIPNIYAGGDAVTGASTVVKAMDAGIKAAKAMIEDLK